MAKHLAKFSAGGPPRPPGPYQHKHSAKFPIFSEQLVQAKCWHRDARYVHRRLFSQKIRTECEDSAEIRMWKCWATYAAMDFERGQRSIDAWYFMFSICFLRASLSMVASVLASIGRGYERRRSRRRRRVVGADGARWRCGGGAFNWGRSCEWVADRCSKAIGDMEFIFCLVVVVVFFLTSFTDYYFKETRKILLIPRNFCSCLFVFWDRR